MDNKFITLENNFNKCRRRLTILRHCCVFLCRRRNSFSQILRYFLCLVAFGEGDDRMQPTRQTLMRVLTEISAISRCIFIPEGYSWLFARLPTAGRGLHRIFQCWNSCENGMIGEDSRPISIGAERKIRRKLKKNWREVGASYFTQLLPEAFDNGTLRELKAVAIWWCAMP